MSEAWPETRASWARLNDKWHRLWAQIFLSWALRAHPEEVCSTVIDSYEKAKREMRS